MKKEMLFLHGSSVLFDDKYFVFLGPSQSGKSTMAGLFHDRGARVISDARTILDFKKKRVLPFTAPPTVRPGPFFTKLQEKYKHLLNSVFAKHGELSLRTMPFLSKNLVSEYFDYSRELYAIGKPFDGHSREIIFVFLQNNFHKDIAKRVDPIHSLGNLYRISREAEKLSFELQKELLDLFIDSKSYFLYGKRFKEGLDIILHDLNLDIDYSYVKINK